MPSVEHPLDHRERAFPRSPFPVNAFVPQFAPDAQGTAPHTPPHRSAVAPGLHAEVSLVPVHHLPLPAQIHLAIVHRGSSRLQIPDEALVDIRLDVELEPESGLGALLRPRSIPATAGPGLLSARFVSLGMTGIRRDERCVLDDALLDAEALPVQLALQLSPHGFVSAGFGESLPEQPDSGGVGDHIGEAEEPAEAEAVVGLPLQLRVG